MNVDELRNVSTKMATVGKVFSEERTCQGRIGISKGSFSKNLLFGGVLCGNAQEGMWIRRRNLRPILSFGHGSISIRTYMQ